jgi:hypothetical protein
VKEFEYYTSRLGELKESGTEHVLVADLCEKILEFWENGFRRSAYPVSFGKRPRSCKDGSLGTPWGLHEIAEKHGDGEQPGMVFVAREATGECWHERPDAGPDQKCLVTTRILRLRGLEPGVNAGSGIDSFDRYIYIHGTNHPEQFPENISAGCLLMRDEDLVELFENVPPGTHVWISHP